MEDINKTRRNALKVAGLALASAGLSGTAVANDKKEGKPVDADSPEISVLAEESRSALYKVKHKGEVSIYRIDETNGGAITKTTVGKASDVQSISASDTDTFTAETDGIQTADVGISTVTTQGWSVVERSGDIDRRIGDCKTDSGYRHQYDGITFSLSKPADVIGKATLAETIGVLGTYYLGTGIIGGIISSLAAIAAAAILSLYTGRHYTVAAKDGFIDWGAGYSPQINGVVANTYDAPVSTTTDVAFIPDVHLGGQHEISSGLAHDNPWQK